MLPDGTVRHIHTVGRPVFGTSGEVIEVVGTHVDITERKRIEEEPERLRRLEADVVHMNRLAMPGELASSLVHEIWHSIDLRTELAPKLPHVFADRVQLQ